MARIRTRLSLPALLSVLLLLPMLGCSGDDDDDSTSGEPTTVQELCSKVFECFDDDWGWPSQDECESQWLTGCKDTTGYLTCAATCVSGDCSGFAAEDGSSGCEPDCWTEQCE